jgi:superfamily II DNA helicase RecQ
VARVTSHPSIDERLFARLRAFRTEEARREVLPAYCILTNKTLEELARRAPADLASLEEVPGIGPAKIEKYGSAILAIVRELAADRAAVG